MSATAIGALAFIVCVACIEAVDALAGYLESKERK